MSLFPFICNNVIINLGIGQVFIAKQKYDAIGTRSNRVLSFEKGEELEVMNPIVGSEWWEVGYVCVHMQIILFPPP